MARRNRSKRSASSGRGADWRVFAFCSVGVLALAFLLLPTVSTHNATLRMSSGAIKIALLAFAVILAFKSIVAYMRHSKSSGGRVEHDAIALSDIPNLDDRRPRPTSWSLELLRSIEWKLFEDLSAAYYKEKGIKAELTKLGADGGIDVKLFQDGSGSPTSIVQCKAWNSKQVGVKEIREFLGVMSHEKIPKGFYMASGVFSTDAKEFAKANRITLIDGGLLLSMIQRLPDDSQKRLLALATAGDYTTPSCPSCGVKMIRRSGKKGEFWGCQNFPRCRQMLHVRRE